MLDEGGEEEADAHEDAARDGDGATRESRAEGGGDGRCDRHDHHINDRRQWHSNIRAGWHYFRPTRLQKSASSTMCRTRSTLSRTRSAPTEVVQTHGQKTMHFHNSDSIIHTFIVGSCVVRTLIPKAFGDLISLFMLIDIFSLTTAPPCWDRNRNMMWMIIRSLTELSRERDRPTYGGRKWAITGSLADAETVWAWRRAIMGRLAER